MTDLSPMEPRFEPKDLRRALGCYPTGVAVVTTLSPEDEPVGLTISSFNSVSLDPPLVLWSLARSAWSLPMFRGNPGFVINVLSAEQAGLAKRFASPVEKRFEAVSWARGLGGRPVLDGASAVFECRNYAQYDGGDHEILLGEIVRFRETDRVPLVFGKGRMGPLHRGNT